MRIAIITTISIVFSLNLFCIASKADRIIVNEKDGKQTIADDVIVTTAILGSPEIGKNGKITYDDEAVIFYARWNPETKRLKRIPFTTGRHRKLR